jgi:hypothetical protein
VAFRDWSEEDKEGFDALAWERIYNEIPSVPYLDEGSDEQARELFQLGWLTWPISQEEAEEYRQQFYDMTYMPENLFRALGFWQEYRELYSDVDTA